MATKRFEAWLVANWREGEFDRFRKTEPDRTERAPTEVPVHVTAEVEVPEFETPEAEVGVEVPRPQVEVAMGEGSDEWHKYVEQGLATFEDRVQAARDNPQGVEFDDAVSTLVGYVVRKADGYPDPDDVSEVVETAIMAGKTEVSS